MKTYKKIFLLIVSFLVFAILVLVLISGGKDKKYEILNDKKSCCYSKVVEVNGVKYTVSRIRALRDVIGPDGKIRAEKGNIGGYIDKESSLSQEHSAWVGDEAVVVGTTIEGYPWISDYVIVVEGTIINQARIKGESIVIHCFLKGHSEVKGTSKLISVEMDHKSQVIDSSIDMSHENSELEMNHNSSIIRSKIIGGRLKLFDYSTIWGSELTNTHLKLEVKANLMYFTWILDKIPENPSILNVNYTFRNIEQVELWDQTWKEVAKKLENL